MKYPYSVKHNGKWYKPGEEVPDTAISKDAKTVCESANLLGTSQVEEVQPESEKVVEDEPKKRRRKSKQ